VEEEAGADASPVAAPDDARTVDSAPPSLGGENTAAVAPRRRQREQGERAAALVARDDFAKKQKSVDVRQQAINAYVAGKKVSAIANFCGVQGEFPPHVLRLHCTQMLRWWLHGVGAERTIYNWLLVYKNYGVVKLEEATQDKKFKWGHC
jgi:hypothetical protein